ncbi:MAG: Ig-like domain-containing protein, partial [Gemmatimonadaceae bacterium]|nr:Ig-like domain-containing protein [Gemmatimonadaceae bacterium]
MGPRVMDVSAARSRVWRTRAARLRRCVAFGAMLMMAACKGLTDMTAPRPLDTPVASVTLSNELVTLGEGASLALQAVARDDDAGVVSDRAIFWSSSDTTVVRVSAAGLLTAVRAGTAQIAATVDGRSATARVTVTARAVASIQITPTAPSVLKGGFAQLTARTLDDAGGLLQNRVVFWSTSDAAVAVVDVGGVVTGIAPGVATVTATSESRTAAVGITVLRVPVASVALSPARDTIVLGQSTQLTAVPRDSAGAALDDLVTFTSSASSIATVSSSGLVVGVAAGSVTITASAGGRQATSIVLVQPRPVGAVIVSPSQSSLTIGQTVQLNVQITDANGNLLSGRPVAYASSNANVASVTSGGLVRAVATGSATITITSEGKTGTATVIVSPSPIATLVVTPATSTRVIGTTV